MTSGIPPSPPQWGLPGYAVVMRDGEPTVYTNLHSVDYWAKPFNSLIAGGTIDPDMNILCAGDPTTFLRDHPDALVRTELDFAKLIDSPQTAACAHRNRNSPAAHDKARRNAVKAYMRETCRIEQELRELQRARQERAREKMKERPYKFPDEAEKAADDMIDAEIARLSQLLSERVPPE